ncbi:hypothetical protein ScPMuIL_013947 [Solemya velum]
MYAFTDAMQRLNRALEYVHRVETSECTGGAEETLYLQFNHSAWAGLTDIALQTGNLFSSILVSHNNSLNSMTDEMIYSILMNNLHGQKTLYGSAVVIEPGIYKYDKLAAYAYRKNGTITVFDAAVHYDYHSNTTEWWHGPKNMNHNNVSLVKDSLIFRSDNALLAEIEEDIPVATLSEGYWTMPYYDCGGGNIWMVTYSAPILGLNYETRKPFFLGIATVDIELTLVDINQCDAEGKLEGALDVFRGTHHCPPTTKCFPLSGLGFRRGAYTCVCVDGYYFPYLKTDRKYFLGFDVEKHRGDANFISQYSCSLCAPGCSRCIDDSPCLYTRNIALRITILFFTFVTIIGITGVSIATYLYRSHRVIQLSSPVFLQLMCFGAMLMCFHLVVIFPEPTSVVCMATIWPIHLGFVLMYGALVMKTWRISVIFRVGLFKRIQLPDHVLLQRLVLCIGATVGVLSVWTAADPPRADTFRTVTGLKYQECHLSWWSHAALGGEVTLLLYGCYLCFVVRKAPAHFNESKKIAWAIYNAIIVGTFNAIITIFMGYSAGPDVLYALSFLEVQVYATITMCFIFGPKFWALYKKTEVSEPAMNSTTGTVSTTRRTKTSTQVESILERLNSNSGESPKKLVLHKNIDVGAHVQGPQNISKARQALEYVYNIEHSDDCNSGTEHTLYLEFNHSAWKVYTDPAIRTANQLSKFLVMNGNNLDSLTDEVLFSMVRNNVHGGTLIFGSAIAVEPGVYNKYQSFCPYAYKKNYTVYAHDIAVNYNYLSESTEWYNAVKIRYWNNASVEADEVKYR